MSRGPLTPDNVEREGLQGLSEVLYLNPVKSLLPITISAARNQKYIEMFTGEFWSRLRTSHKVISKLMMRPALLF